MKTVGAYEAKTHLAHLLDEAAKGETITITRHGAPVAMLVPYKGKSREEIREAIEEFKEWQAQQNITLDGLTIRELIEEGRR